MSVREEPTEATRLGISPGEGGGGSEKQPDLRVLNPLLTREKVEDVEVAKRHNSVAGERAETAISYELVQAKEVEDLKVIAQLEYLLQRFDFTHVYKFLTVRDVCRLLQCSQTTHEMLGAWDQLWYARVEARESCDSLVLACPQKLLTLLEQIEFQVTRICYDDVSEVEFVKRFENHPGCPVVISGATKHFPDTWSLSNWKSRFGDEYFRFDDRFGERVKLRHYCHYLEVTNDLNPIGIYDSQFGESNRVSSSILDDYQVPRYFRQDMFDTIVEGRPPYRWVLVGARGGGTEMHIDPLWTSAWVTLMQGRKRWCLFPRGSNLEQINSKCKTAFEWFDWFYRQGGKDKCDVVPVEILQQQHETVFVPAGWAHIVINLDTTVAITHNYAAPQNWHQAHDAWQVDQS